MIDGYPNFEWSPGNTISDGYTNEGDDKSEYEHKEGGQEEILLEDEVDIHEPLEDEDAIQEMDEDEYHKEDPKIISE